MKALPLTYTLGTALVLSSCVCDIGGVIRAGAVEHVAVDTNRPSGGLVYRNRNSAAEVMLAPEVAYHGRDGMVYDLFVHDCYIGCPEVKDTGRQLWVRKGPDGDYVLLGGPPSAAWKPMQLKEIPKTPTRANRLKAYDSREVGDKAFRAVLAAPFDYALDPVLTVGMNATMFVAEVLTLPFQLLYYSVASPAEADHYHSTVEPEAT